MTKHFPLHPSHPERVCWGCDRYCKSDAMSCGNGSERTQHPSEIFGPDWAEWGLDPFAPAAPAAAESAPQEAAQEAVALVSPPAAA